MPVSRHTAGRETAAHNGHPKKGQAELSVNAGNKMRGTDWLLLIAVSLVVSVCGVVGVSYVGGQGEPQFDGFEVAVLTAIFAVVAAVVFFLMDKLFDWICRRSKPEVIAVVLPPEEPFPAGAPVPAPAPEPMADPEPEQPEQPRTPQIICYGPKDLFERRAIPDLARYPSTYVEPAYQTPQAPLEEPPAPFFGEVPPADFPPAEPVIIQQERRTFLGTITPHWSTVSIIVCCLVMAAFWAPWLIANYPGGTYWDTYYQIFQVYPENHPIAIIPWAEIYDQTLTDAWLVDHHPVLTTLLYGAFGWTSDQLTGNWMAGVFLFCLLQGIAHIVAFVFAIAYLRRRGAPLVLCFCAYAFFCIMPFVSTWAMCMVKDSLFGVLCVPYFIMLFEAVRTNGESLSRPRAIVLFVVLGLLLCLTRKMGIFMVVPTAIILWLVLRSRAPRMTLQAEGIDPVTGTPLAASRLNRGAGMACAIQAVSCVLVIGLLLPFVIFPLANIAPGGTQETLGPLFQQTARYLRDHGDEISVQEKRAVSAVLDYEQLADQYEYDFADSVKYRYNLDATPEQLLEYLRAYATMGARHPDSYLAAFASLAGFYVAPTAYANIRMVTVDTHMGDDDRYMLWNPDELDEMRLGMDEAYTAVAETPGVNILLLIVTYAFWLPMGLLFTCMRRQLRAGVLLVPAFIMLAFLLISPVYDARYCVPIFDLAPLLVCAFGAIGATISSNRAVWEGEGLWSHSLA